MKFESTGEILKVEEKSFVNEQGQTVKYIKARFLTAEGEIISCTTTPEVLDTIGDESKIKVVATFLVSPDSRTQNAKVKLVSVTLD